MKIGDKVKSRPYAAKGVATVVRFNRLFEREYAELLYPNGETLSVTADDLVPVTDPVYNLAGGSVHPPEAFFARYAEARMQSTLTERALVSSINYKIKPLPHQLLAVDFVMSRFRPRCLIADEVGLGKTIEAVLVYQELKLRGIARRILIIVPSGLVLQWQEELRMKFNERFVVYQKDFIRQLKQTYGEETNVWTLHDQIIASIDSIKPYRIKDDLEAGENERREWHNRHVSGDIATAGFDVVVFDEAHRLTKQGDGSESARFKLGKSLADSVPILLLLTATPHQGDENLFLNLLKLIDPVLFRNKSSLQPELVREIAVRNQKRAAVDFEGNRVFKHRITSLIEIRRDEAANADELALYALVTEYTEKFYNLAVRRNDQILRFLIILYQRITASSSFAVLDTLRRRRAVLQSGSLPASPARRWDSEEDELSEEEIIRAVTWEQAEDVQAELAFIDNCIAIAERISRAFADQKFKRLIELIDELKQRERNPELKLIIFTEFRATQAALIDYLSRFGYRCAHINGSLSPEEKVAQTERFKHNADVLVSTDAGGEGINLQFCYCMINFDLPWNPTRIEQRIGRIDRIGQQRDVLIFNLQLVDTVEDRVRSILEKKLELIKTQFGEDKYADVITLLQEEFSFDKLYLDAMLLKDRESSAFEKQAEQIYQRARDILNKDDLLIPFTQPEQDARELLNRDCNHLVSMLVLNYLKTRSIEVTPYRENPQACYFANPFRKDETESATYRHVVFDNEHATAMDKSEFINIEHPLVQAISREIRHDFDYGTSSAIRLQVHKFGGMKGFWFNYQLTIKNNLDKKYIVLVPVFMEDRAFCNTRLSHYLGGLSRFEFELIQNFTPPENLAEIQESAFQEAQKMAMDIFSAKQIEWRGEIDRYSEKLEAYYQYKENAIRNLPIENIRQVRIEKNLQEKQEALEVLERKRIIVPQLDLIQIAYMEFA